MHTPQYEAYKSGKAKADFEADLAKRKAAKNSSNSNNEPKTITVSVNGMSYKVNIAYGVQTPKPDAPAVTPVAAPSPAGSGHELLAPLEGKFFLVKGASDTPAKIGDIVNEGDVVCYIEAMKTYNAIKADTTGTITAICFNAGDSVSEDDVLMIIS